MPCHAFGLHFPAHSYILVREVPKNSNQQARRAKGLPAQEIWGMIYTNIPCCSQGTAG